MVRIEFLEFVLFFLTHLEEINFPLQTNVCVPISKLADHVIDQFNGDIVVV